MADEEEQKEQKPLPLTFYNQQGWMDSLVDFYCEKHNVLPRAVCEAPFKVITDAAAGVVDVYGNFPKDTCVILYQTIDKNYNNEEYREKIYKVLKEESVTKDLPNFSPMADHLLRLRLIFEKDDGFHNMYFKKQIALTEPSEEFPDAADRFKVIIRDITVQHLSQVIGLVQEFLKETGGE